MSENVEKRSETDILLLLLLLLLSSYLTIIIIISETGDVTAEFKNCTILYLS